ncbi:helix-turn-helix transcriptional regulator [Terasakiella sp. A23]|uniref:helix-turn-helix domain-containing protein n=1 Tax=Terasakiella sp. FCG-A23 TaxID=3080561 RepID=UPI0029532F0F|nr:helix-turn-helix transcriptional regulator [Terasakiella sp. A23]MDV7340246.1 helix-turn-helix transcriptional regulator [Terasakiella sp. A23]
MSDDFARNLKFACGYYKSIAEVCRKLNLNRAQFNRYLSGRHKPSANAMMRLCDFFGMEEFEFLLPHDQFQRLLQVKPRSQVVEKSSYPELEHLSKLHQAGGNSLEKYLGYYFEYYYSMSSPGKILRTLICIERQGDGVYYQRTERFQEATKNVVCHGRYKGVALFLTDRIFMLDYEALTGYEITETILFPTFRNKLSRLTGLKLGVSGSGERMPCCTRVVYEYLGRSINKHRALSLCGLYDPDESEIEDSLKQALANTISPDEMHFRARH